MWRIANTHRHWDPGTLHCTRTCQHVYCLTGSPNYPDTADRMQPQRCQMHSSMCLQRIPCNYLPPQPRTCRPRIQYMSRNLLRQKMFLLGISCNYLPPEQRTAPPDSLSRQWHPPQQRTYRPRIQYMSQNRLRPSTYHGDKRYLKRYLGGTRAQQRRTSNACTCKSQLYHSRDALYNHLVCRSCCVCQNRDIGSPLPMCSLLPCRAPLQIMGW